MYNQTNPLFSKLRASEHAASIYYADLFRINGNVWALTGTGKSSAGLAATSERAVDDLARDSVAFVREGSTLLGRLDPGAISSDNVNTLHALHPLAAVVYCCSEAETAELFHGRPLQLAKIDSETVGALLSKRPYTGFLARHVFDNEQLSHLHDPTRRLLHWRQITSDVVGVRWLLAPWMPSAIEKGALYASYGL